MTGVAPWIPLIIVVTNQHIPGAMKNAGIIKVMKLWREHRLWRLYSLQPNTESQSVLFIHCINEIHRIQSHLENATNE